jgi:EAL domain-containing protein (putative c-di-GMP-specific phosphodiesterase class I)
MVADRLAAHGLAGTDLIIELTETLTLTQVDLVSGVLRQLRDLGVQLALDDFGTRSSSLAMLAKVPFFELKIDRSFVSTMGRSPEALAVVRSTVELGRALHRYVVAEGVEREQERRALWEMGCPAGQGHLFARPMPIDMLMAVLEPGLDGVVGRIAAPLHTAPNVVSLPRSRRPPDAAASSETPISEPPSGSVGWDNP